MDTWTVIILLHYLLFASWVRSAPVGSASSLPPAFRETALEAKTLGEKILKDISAAHAATVQDFSLDSSTSSLQLMAASMGIPSSPVLKALSAHFTLETCVSRMLAGVQMYQNLLEVLSSKVSGLDDLRADLRDLLNHINKLKEVAQLTADVSDQNPSTDLTSHLQDSHNIQVALHLTLTQLRSFCHDLNRTFRVLSTYRP
ncbi:granulocyte colony-stimulating factor-like [Poeciliopsis prolifica]|uniref:granulocyte colony-stimulating factor-like n=1 Tax=Poeciliopsis prolifica TaxID=188132 RepID=UPI0024131245|nr:granulocyte colony-stimulating factor-like [Poeciliopsis prolifica]